MCVESGNQQSTPLSAAGISERDIEQIGNKIRNLCNIGHRINGYHVSLFLDIEPAATTAKYINLDIYKL
jgi:hypothetical protein